MARNMRLGHNTFLATVNPQPGPHGPARNRLTCDMARRIRAAIFLTSLAVGCHSTNAPTAVDPAMTACLPAGIGAIAGINLERLRSSPLYTTLPDSIRAMAATYQTAQRLLAAYDGRGMLVIARGAFPETPAGASPAGTGLVLFGPPDMVRAALTQQRTGRTGVPALTAFATSIASANPLWVALQGGVTLPVTGNAVNLNRLLGYLEFAGLTVQLEPTAVIRLTAPGRTAQDARQFEETLRAMLTLAAASRQPDVAALLAAIPVERRDRTTTAVVTVPGPMLQNLLGRLIP